MKSLPVLALAIALAGCTSVEHQSYGSWLDKVGERGEREKVRYPFTAEETQALQAQAAALNARAETLRLKLSSEKDRVQRIAYMEQLNDIGDDLRPIQRQLRDGGTRGRRYPDPAPYTQGGGE